MEATGNIGTVEIKVNSFMDVISFQGSVNWDPTSLVFAGVSDFGIKDFDADNFGTTSADEGHVRFVWEPNDAVAVSADDSTVLFSIQFEFISNEPQEVPISFTDITSDPAFPIEFANGSFEVISVSTHDGSITFFDEITGLEDLHEEGISIYPNPFQDFVRISNQGGNVDMIRVFDLHGLTIKEIYNVKDKFIDLHLNGSSNGIYLINIHKDGKILTRKVVKNLSR